MVTYLAVLEDDPLTRTTLGAALHAASDCEVVTATASPKDLLATISTTRVDVIICDLHIGDGPSGIEVAHAARRLNPALGVVFLTNFNDPRLLDRPANPLPSGSEYLVKRDVESLAIVKEAITRARKRATSRTPRAPSQAEPALTATQLEILRMVAQGLTNKEIAATRHVSEKTVEQAISRLAKTLGLQNEPSGNQRVHLVRAYFRALGMTLP
jgi:two-component system, NarL family, nitrate/nitrite response regulator NarL